MQKIVTDLSLIYEDRIENLLPKYDGSKICIVHEGDSMYLNSLIKTLETYKINCRKVDLLINKPDEEVEIINYLQGYSKVLVINPISDEKLINLINMSIKSHQDLDGLKLEWAKKPEKELLPITAEVIADIIDMKDEILEFGLPIYLRGFGNNTNKPLFHYLMDKGYRVVASNSKVGKDRDRALIDSAHMIVSSTGIPNSLVCTQKIVLSPTIHLEDGKYSHDLHRDYVKYNKTHEVRNSIGLLTRKLLIIRCLS